MDDDVSQAHRLGVVKLGILHRLLPLGVSVEHHPARHIDNGVRVRHSTVDHRGEAEYLCHRAGFEGFHSREVGRGDGRNPSVLVAYDVRDRVDLPRICVHHDDRSSGSLHLVDAGQERLLDLELQGAIEGEHQIGTGHRLPGGGTRTGDRESVSVLFAHPLAIDPGEQVVVLTLESAGPHTIDVSPAEHTAPHLTAGHDPLVFRDHVDSGEVQRHDRLGHIVVDLTGDIDEALLLGGEGVNQVQLLLRCKTEQGREHTSGTRRIGDQLRVGDDRARRDA